MPHRRKGITRIMEEGDDVSSLPYDDHTHHDEQHEAATTNPSDKKRVEHGHGNQHQQQQQQRRRNKNSTTAAATTNRRRARQQHGQSSSTDLHERSRRYLYSAISATFFFVLFRELGWIDHMQTTLNEQQELLRNHASIRKEAASGGIGSGGTTSSTSSLNSYGGGSSSIPKFAAAAANLAATSMSLSQRTNNINGGGNSGNNGGVGNVANSLTRGEMMEHVSQSDHSITPGSRPIIYTFFEWIPPRSRGTSMSDVADKALITEWKAAWKAAGWHPMILTLDDAKKHSQYNDYAPKLNKIPMLGVDGLGGTVIYNQLCFLRWLAVAAVGGGFLCDYDVFPISHAPSTPTSMAPPHDGNFTVYCRIKHSKRAGIPCLMSGRTEEWTRMAYALLANGEKNAGTESMWSDMLALIDMRNDHAYDIYDAVLEGQDVLLKRGWTAADCNMTASKEAIHFSHEALKLGYLPPGETAEDRPEIIRRFLAQWQELCGRQSEAKQLVLGDTERS